MEIKMIKFKRGDLIELAKQGKYDIILHGINCHCKMSDGVALQLAQAFPIIQEADLNTVPLDRSKLGQFMPVPLSVENRSFLILNCYTQLNYAGYDLEESDLFDYVAFQKILRSVASQYYKEKIAMPLIGAGHAGGDTEKIINIIQKELKDCNVDVIVYRDNDCPKELNSISNKFRCFMDKILK